LEEQRSNKNEKQKNIAPEAKKNVLFPSQLTLAVFICFEKFE
jgi:hypothetical protein